MVKNKLVATGSTALYYLLIAAFFTSVIDVCAQSPASSRLANRSQTQAQASGPAGTIELVAVSASGNIVSGLDTNDIVLSAGGVTVKFEIKLSGWDTPPGEKMKGYIVGIAGSQAAAYAQASSMAGAPPITLAVDGMGSFFTFNFVDESRADWVFQGTNFFPVPPTQQATRYRLSAATADAALGTAEVPVLPGYGGEFVFDVPVGAKGTYAIQLGSGNARAEFSNNLGIAFAPAIVRTGTIEIATGRCCHNLGTPSEGCADDETESECLAAPMTESCNTLRHPGGGACAFTADCDCSLDCSPCISNSACTPKACSISGNTCFDASRDCPPGESCSVNLCVTGLCDIVGSPCGARCTYSNDHTFQECCDPSTGQVTGTNVDGQTCSQNVCTLDGSTPNSFNLGQPFFPPAPPSTVCDDGLQCTINDRCDGLSANDSQACGGEDSNLISCVADPSICPANSQCDGQTCVCLEQSACCLPDKSCSIQSATNCFQAGGQQVVECLGDRNGDGINESCFTFAGCCLPDDTCQMLDSVDCAAANGTVVTRCFGDRDSNGKDDACVPVAILSCCGRDATCSLVDEILCVEEGGFVIAACGGDVDGDGLDDACRAELIPAVSDWGIVILVLLLLTLSKIWYGIAKNQRESLS